MSNTPFSYNAFRSSLEEAFRFRETATAAVHAATHAIGASFALEHRDPGRFSPEFDSRARYYFVVVGPEGKRASPPETLYIEITLTSPKEAYFLVRESRSSEEWERHQGAGWPLDASFTLGHRLPPNAIFRDRSVPVKDLSVLLAKDVAELYPLAEARLKSLRRKGMSQGERTAEDAFEQAKALLEERGIFPTSSDLRGSTDGCVSYEYATGFRVWCWPEEIVKAHDALRQAWIKHDEQKREVQALFGRRKD